MKYVLDSSVAVKWVLLEQFSDKAKRLRADFQTHVHELVSPDFFPLEVMHALTRAERQGRISLPQGGILWADVMTTPPRLVPSLPLAPPPLATRATTARAPPIAGCSAPGG
jgi:hypothetical protein